MDGPSASTGDSISGEIDAPQLSIHRPASSKLGLVQRAASNRPFPRNERRRFRLRDSEASPRSRPRQGHMRLEASAVRRSSRLPLRVEGRQARRGRELRETAVDSGMYLGGFALVRDPGEEYAPDFPAQGKRLGRRRRRESPPRPTQRPGMRLRSRSHSPRSRLRKRG